MYFGGISCLRIYFWIFQGIQQHKSSHYLDSVKKVGLELRRLLAAVDQIVPAFPVSTHRQVNIHSNMFFVKNKFFKSLMNEEFQSPETSEAIKY